MNKPLTPDPSPTQAERGETNCHTCQLVERRDSGDAPLWDSIYRTPYWDVAHANNTSLLGWIAIVARRHIAAVDEMSEEEAAELGRLLRKISILLKQETGCLKTYVVQFAEAPGHQHVHFHVIPRMIDQPDDHKEPNIFKYLGVPEEQRVSEADMNALGLQIQRSLSDG